MNMKQVQLSGKCTLQIDTMRSNTKIEISKVNRDGVNNADCLIDNVLHFAVMRHGADKLLEIVNDKIKQYPEYKTCGLNYDTQ